MSDDVYDITIIGGGPTGCFALFYAGVREMKAKIIEAMNYLGGQLTALYPEKHIYDMPGFPKVLGRDLARDMEKQALQWGATVCLGEKVLDLKARDDKLWEIVTEKAVHLTKTVLICAGVGAFAPRKLGVPDIDDLVGKGAYHNMPPRDVVQGKDVLIVGGGDSAVEWALELSEGIARSVILVHRRDRFRAHEESVRRLLLSSKIKVFVNQEIKGLCDSGPGLHCVVVYDSRTKQETQLPCDVLLLGLGFVADVGTFKKWGLDIEENSIKVDTQGETNLPGVFAAGDIVTYPGKVKLIATGAAEAVAAVTAARYYLDPAAKPPAVHSSEDPRFAR